MLGVEYFKAEPTEFVRMRAGNKVKKEGEGIAGFYLPFRTTIELISMSRSDQPFSFVETSTENQEVTLQGSFVYAVTNPRLTISQFNFSVDPKNKEYLTDENQKLPEQVLAVVRGEAKRIVQATALEKILFMGAELSDQISKALTGTQILSPLGIELKSLYFDSIRAKPEISKALEANYREGLLQKADEAIYTRRALAVEKERAIKENELRTSINLEEQRKQLVELQGANVLKEADFKAQAVEKELAAYTAAGPQMVVAQALLRLGTHAEKIGNLTITPDILAGLLNKA